jgi:hypothetical protein
MYQPVSVPVGLISLGRIFNVTGSSIDSYADLMTSCCFYDNPLMATAIDSEGTSQRPTYSLLTSSPKGLHLKALGLPYAQHCHHISTEHLVLDKMSASMYQDFFRYVTLNALDVWVYFYVCYYLASNATQLPSNYASCRADQGFHLASLLGELCSHVKQNTPTDQTALTATQSAIASAIFSYVSGAMYSSDSLYSSVTPIHKIQHL